MADIARMLSKLDKALVARSELKKQPIEKNWYTSANNAKANKGTRSNAGHTVNSEYEKDRQPIRGAPKSNIGLDRNNVPGYTGGLPYVTIDEETGSRFATDKDNATLMPRMVLKPGKSKGEPGEMVPARDAKGDIIYDPIPYNYPILLNPDSNPPYMPFDYKLKKEPVREADGEEKLDRFGKPIMRFARDKDGRYIPELDAQGNPVPLPVERNRDGDLVRQYQIDPDYVKNRVGIHSLGVDKDAEHIRNLLTTGATWDEAMDILKKEQAAELDRRERNAWLKRLSTIFRDADNIGVGATGEDGSSSPHYAVNRELMNWYWKKPEPEQFNDSISPRFANNALKHRNPYFSPGMPVGRLQEYTDPETGETRFRVWHPEKGPIEFLGPTSTLKDKHIRAIRDALSRMDGTGSFQRELADALRNARNGIDDGALFHGLTASEILEYADLNKRLESDPKNPMAKEWRKRSNELSRKMDYDSVTMPRAEDLYDLFQDPDAYSKNHASVDPSRANDLAVKLMNNNPEMWGWLREREWDYNDMVRLFSSLPRDAAERFAETGMLDLNPLPGYKPPKHSTLGDEIRDRAIFNEMARRRSSAKNWLSNKGNKELAGRALEFFDTDEGKQFLQDRGYADPLIRHREIMELMEKLKNGPQNEQEEKDWPVLSREWTNDIRDYLKGAPKSMSYGMQTLTDAATILLNEKGEEDRAREEARDRNREISAKEWIESVLNKAYDVPLPEGTVFETGESDEGRAEELRQKQLQTIKSLTERYQDIAGLWRTDNQVDPYDLEAPTKRQAALEEAMKPIRAMYPGKSDIELQRILEQGKEADNIIRSFSPDSKGGSFFRIASELLGRNPTERTGDAAQQAVSEATGRVEEEVPLYDALRNQFGEGWKNVVYGRMMKDYPLKIIKTSNRLLDLTKSINPYHKDNMAVLKQLKRLSGGDEDSVFYRWADSLERLMDTRAEMNKAINERLNGEKSGTWDGVMDEFMTRLRRNGFNGFEDLDFGTKGNDLARTLLGDIDYSEIHPYHSKKIDDTEILPVEQQSRMHGAVQPNQVRYDRGGYIAAQPRPLSEKGRRVSGYDFGSGKNAKTPLAKQMEKEAEEEAKQGNAAKQAEATLKRKEREERKKQEAEAATVLDGDAVASAGDTNEGTEETVVPLTEADKALAARAKDAAKNSNFVAPQVDASKRLNPTIYGNKVVRTALNADGSKIQQEIPGPSGHVGQTPKQEYLGLNRVERRDTITGEEHKNNDILGKKELNLSGRRPTYKPKKEDTESFKESVSTMEDMRNMSLRDMMDSIAKNTGKDGHPYGAPIGGSVFAFGCVPVRMGGDGRERGMPADIPTAKTNDEGLTSRRVEMGRVRSNRWPLRGSCSAKPLTSFYSVYIAPILVYVIPSKCPYMQSVIETAYDIAGIGGIQRTDASRLHAARAEADAVRYAAALGGSGGRQQAQAGHLQAAEARHREDDDPFGTGCGDGEVPRHQGRL